MKFSFLILCAILMLLACNPSIKIPSEVLDQDKMVAILIDIHLLEGQLEQLSLPQDSAKKVFNAHEMKIFQKHNVAENHYRDSYSWYFNNVRAVEAIYARVVDSLLVRQQSKRLYDNETLPQ